MKYAYLLKLKPKRLKICMPVNSDNSTILKLVSNTLSIIQYKYFVYYFESVWEQA